MAWGNRYNCSMTDRDMESLIENADTCVWLKNDTAMNNAGSMQFGDLVGLGVERDFTVSSKEDLPKLRDWLSSAQDLVLGYFCYDLKGLLENLKTANPDRIGFPLAYFFIPEVVVVRRKDGHISAHSNAPSINIQPLSTSSNQLADSRIQDEDRSSYVGKVNSLLQHIQLGDVYELNYCIENRIDDIGIDPLHTFMRLQKYSPAPFSCYVAHDGKYLLSSSPERFMSKIGSRLVSQPMKGTNKRTELNEVQKLLLGSDMKEVAENVMITDLVRNDLSKSAKTRSVAVDELCGVYEFEHVNQMISTVSCDIRDDVHPMDALLNAFPMGSMTGAPKIKAMQLIEEHEDFARGLYSGSVGYFTPELDFDFNVVIRSILYNKDEQRLSFPTGGAITINSDPEMEYEECMLKAEAMRKVLLGDGK